MFSKKSKPISMLQTIFITTCLTMTPSQIFAMDHTPATTSQSEAQSVLNKAISAAGGYEALSAMRSATTTFSTSTANPGQAPTPTKNPELGNAFRSLAYRSDGRLAIENFNGENLTFRYVRGAGPDWAYLAGQNNVALIDPQVATGILDRVRTSADLLLELADNSASLRSAGSVTKEDKTYNVLTFADSLGRAQNIYFEASSGQLVGSEVLTAHAQWGDLSTKMHYSDFKDINGVSLAHKAELKQAGIRTAQITLEAIGFDDIDENLFVEPKDAGKADPISAPGTAPRELTVEELAKNIYFIENAAQGYNIIFVNNRDGVTILETPQSPQSARDIISTINKTLPRKTIKRAVPTHHHFDHSGGIYGFQEANIGILTTPGNEEFVREIGTASRNIGRNNGTPENIGVETFTDKRTIGRGSRKIELFNVGPNPHAEEIVVAYLPEIKSLFVADIFSARGEELPPANANQLAFAEKLEALELDIETFIPVHGRKATSVEFWDSVKRGRDQAAQAVE